MTPVGPQIKITQTHAEHTSEIAVIDPVTKKSTTYPPGEPTGFLIELENGFKIYHMGDTRLFGDMKLIGEYYKPDLIMIPMRALRDAPAGGRLRQRVLASLTPANSMCRSVGPRSSHATACPPMNSCPDRARASRSGPNGLRLC